MLKYFSLVKFSHTVFALPFAILGFFLATYRLKQGIDFRTLLLIVFCMVFARSAAMAFNRFLDRDIDRRNPRTAGREIPAGAVTPRAALIFVIVNSLLFVATTWLINPLCFALSPLALAVVLGYSYTKRFTALCHLVLGLGLSLAPIGAYLAVGGAFGLVPILFSMVVLFWVAGFDVIYALQDEEFDKTQQLRSIPVAFGKRGGLRVAAVLHLFCAAMLLLAVWQSMVSYPQLGPIAWAASAAFLALLVYQHLLVKPDDLSRVNMAFFTTNGVGSVLFCSMFVLDFFV